MNKRLIAIFACIAVFVSVIILMAAVFVVREISVIAPNSIIESEAKVVDDSGIRLNTNMFTVSGDKASNNIELSNPYIKVVDVVKIFPSTVRIRIDERYPMIAVPVNNASAYAVLDEDMKILTVQENKPEGTAVVSGYRIQGISEENIGQFIQLSDSDNTFKLKSLQQIMLAMQKHGFIRDRFTAFVNTIDLSRSDFVVLRTAYGANIAMRTNSTLSVDKHFDALYSYFCDYMTDKTKANYIFVTENGIVERTQLPD